MNQETVQNRPTRRAADVSLAGLAPAEALYRMVCADPAAPLAVSICGPGGVGKSALLAALRQAYTAAGVQVVGQGAVAVGLTQPPEMAVLVDDAHELDGPDLDRLRRLALAGNVRLAVAYRPWPRNSELDELADILCRGQSPVLLGRLDRTRVQIRAAALLGTIPPATVVDLLCEQTGGVPQLVDRVLGSLRDGAVLDGDDPKVPADVVDLLRHELDRLPARLRALLLAASLGAAVDPEVLAQVLTLDPAVVVDLVSQAQASGLLAGSGLGEAVVVPLVRTALVTATPVETMRVLQRRVLAAHIEHRRPVLGLAQELVEAGARGSDLAAVLEAEGDAALCGPAGPDAPARAAQLYAQAVAAGAAAPSLAARRAEASALAGDLNEALRLADQVLSDPSCPDLARGANVAAVVLAQRGLLARSAEVYRWIGKTRLGSMASLATLALLGIGSLSEAREMLADSDGDRPPTLLAGVESHLATGVLESVAGSPTAALSTLTRAAALLEPGGRAVLLPDTPAALAALVALHSGELDIAVSVLDRARTCAAGGSFALPRYQLLLGWAAMIRGDTALARSWLARTRAGSRGLEPREELLAAALAVGLARRESDLPTLLTAWGAAREAIVRHPVDLFSLLPLGELAVAAARLREFDRVAPHLEQARILLARLGDPPLWSTPLHWYGLHAAILREQPEAAEPHAGALAKAAKSSHYAAVLAAAGRAWMDVLAGQFEVSEVESVARGLRSIGLANDGSRLAGQAAIRTTDRKAMVALLGCARALQATGPGAAGPAVDGDPEQLPEQVPASRPAAVISGPPVLSNREREVAELVLIGLTYRQIGQRLFISAKTVEHHMARMRQRLDVTTRDELFAQLRLLVG
ncbi:MAG: LuxR C-terminal-related transcriptional regulator [Pseudonocardiaceae bacterium]